jgi:hypothetical protein
MISLPMVSDSFSLQLHVPWGTWFSLLSSAEMFTVVGRQALTEL